MAHSMHWTFPLPTCHHGVLLGNGLMGLMVWGTGQTLRVTVGRADFWDHRGGLPWTAEMNYARIKSLLEARDEAGLRGLFEGPKDRVGPRRPTLLPVGRFDIDLPAPLSHATLDLQTGVAVVHLATGHVMKIELAPRDPVAQLTWAHGDLPVRPVPAGPYARTDTGGTERAWAARGLPDPETVDRLDLAGFVQSLPVDPALCAGYRKSGGHIYLVTERGEDAHAAVVEAVTLASRAIAEGPDRFSADAKEWWAEFWARAPKVELPNPTLARLYHYGMYKLAASTNPRGVACGLQGPWIEDDRCPPWSSDYHFNINVQMCYAPAYAGGQASHLRPLWRMLRDWEPRLRAIARDFVGLPTDPAHPAPPEASGLMLPHAVDDRCTNMGGFWSGTIDHGCTAWVARMMFDAWHHGLEPDDFLEDTVYPWLTGALNVYRAMAEKRPDGSYVLPVTVSPEYRGSAMNAWGENASFQLAACHALLDALELTCARLGKPYLPEWAEFRKGLPAACVQPLKADGWTGLSGPQICLWKDTPLEESHRHHSHLAAITPFGTIDPLSPEWREVVDRSLTRWIERGMGNWSGWCLSWAAQLHARVGNASAAEFILEAFARFFVNDGHGVFHNVVHRGYSTMGGSALADWNWQAMQLDGGQGSCAAVLDMLAHARRVSPHTPVTHVVALFPGCPASWHHVAFDNLTLPGAFKLSATRSHGTVTRLTLTSPRGGTFLYTDPATGETKAVPTTPGQTVHLV